VLDNRLRLSPHSILASTTDAAPTIVFTNCIDPETVAPLTDRGVAVVPIEGGARNLSAVLDELRKLDIQSVLVEGGTAVAGAFVDARLVDKVTLIYAPLMIGGAAAPAAIGGRGADSLEKALRLTDVNIRRHGDDVEITGYPEG
jgi:diaminohydroxyphosphoribosylaminopyrimidine deaminase / 5-amino-6-(5-phosphoribosylamino)uracil reductase